MNKKLHFTWGHIICFVGAIAFGYVSFVGSVYLFDGNFLYAGICTAAILLLVLFFFIMAQQLKGSDDNKFEKNIKWERFFFWGSFVVYVLCLFPFLHTWHVQANHEKIETSFSNAITDSRVIFDEYEAYSNDRIVHYQQWMDSVVGAKNLMRNEYQSFGFVARKEEQQKQIQMETLKLLLLSDNYDSLKVSAGKWIDNSSQNASVWNVFLIGNINQIDSAIVGWRNTLQSEQFSGNSLKTEHYVAKFDADNHLTQRVESKLNELHGLFTGVGFPSPLGILCAILGALMFVTPYVVQNRSTRNWYALIGYQKWCKDYQDPNGVSMDPTPSDSDAPEGNKGKATEQPKNGPDGGIDVVDPGI